MKLYISENIDKAIQGFELLPIIYGEVDFTRVPENAFSTVVAVDAIDSIPSNKIESFIKMLCHTLRLGGNLAVGGVDAYSISRSLVSGNIDLKEYNTLITKKNGIYTLKYILDLLVSHGLSIQSAVYKGNYYEITATRQQNKN